jgi:hypothetical protein
MLFFRNRNKGIWYESGPPLGTPPATPPAGTPPPAAGTPPPTPPATDPPPGPVPYDRFKTVNDRATEAERKLKEIQDNQAKADNDKLVAEKKWEDLYNGEKTKLAAKETEFLRLKILTSKILPDDAKDHLSLMDRLRGNTEEEITTDADALLALVKPVGKGGNGGGGTPGTRGSGTPPVVDYSKETDPKKIREMQKTQQG